MRESAVPPETIPADLTKELFSLLPVDKLKSPFIFVSYVI
jgi:hypothetical protein